MFSYHSTHVPVYALTIYYKDGTKEILSNRFLYPLNRLNLNQAIAMKEMGHLNSYEWIRFYFNRSVKYKSNVSHLQIEHLKFTELPNKNPKHQVLKVIHQVRND